MTELELLRQEYRDGSKKMFDAFEEFMIQGKLNNNLFHKIRALWLANPNDQNIKDLLIEALRLERTLQEFLGTCHKDFLNNKNIQQTFKTLKIQPFEIDLPF